MKTSIEHKSDVSGKLSRKYPFIFKSGRAIWILLFCIVSIGVFLRCRNFVKYGLKNNNCQSAAVRFISMAVHLMDKGFYNYDKRVALESEAGGNFRYNPAHKDESILLKYGDKPVYGKYYPNDQGLSVIYWTALKIFSGINTGPFTLVWMLQLLADTAVIVFIFLICRMMAGNVEGLLAAFFYAIMALVDTGGHFFSIQTTFYYYWMRVFSVISTFFWIWAYKSEINIDMSKSKRILVFMLYGAFVGFFSIVRITTKFIIPFMALPYLIFTDKKTFYPKIAAILAGVMIQVAVLMPLVMYNKKEFGIYTTTSPRYMWSQIMIGIGFHDNPYGLYFDDYKVLEVAERKCGIEMDKRSINDKTLNVTVEQIKEFEECSKKEIFYIMENTPFLMLKNAVKNLYHGFLLVNVKRAHASSRLLRGFNKKKLPNILYSLTYPVLLCISMLYLFFVNKEKLYGTVILLLMSAYILGTVCLTTPPFSFYIDGYYPLFYILLAVSAVNVAKAVRHIFAHFGS